MNLKFLVIPCLVLGIVGFATHQTIAQCEGGDEFCSWERGNKWCSDSSECCSGSVCNAFGFCERRR